MSKDPAHISTIIIEWLNTFANKDMNNKPRIIDKRKPKEKSDNAFERLENPNNQPRRRKKRGFDYDIDENGRVIDVPNAITFTYVMVPGTKKPGESHSDNSPTVTRRPPSILDWLHRGRPFRRVYIRCNF